MLNANSEIFLFVPIFIFLIFIVNFLIFSIKFLFIYLLYEIFTNSFNKNNAIKVQRNV